MMASDRALPPLLLVIMLVPGCITATNTGADGLQGIYVYSEEGLMTVEYHAALKEAFESNEAIYSTLFDSSSITYRTLDLTRFNYVVPHEYAPEDRASLSVFIIKNNTLDFSGTRGPTNQALINIAGWEEVSRLTNVTDSPLCHTLGLNEYRDLWPDFFHGTLVHEVGHVYGLVGRWWETDRQDPERGSHSSNQASVMYHQPTFEIYDMVSGYCYGPVENIGYDPADLSDLERAASMRPFVWE